MDATAVIPGEDIDDFKVALDNIESSDPLRRRQGILILERLGDARSLRVIAALATDPDLTIARYARSAAKKLETLGVRWRGTRRTRKKLRRESIKSGLEVMDEVFFIIHRTFRSLLWVGFVTGFGKILGGLILLAISLSTFTMPLSYGTWIGILFVGHLLLLRPTAIGVQIQTLLNGFNDREGRILAHRQLTSGDFSSLFRCNLLERSPIFLILGLVLAEAFLVQGVAELFLWAVVLGFGFLSVVLMPLMPLQVLERQSVMATLSRALQISWNYLPVLKIIYPSFLAFYAILYLIVGGAVCSVGLMFDPLQWGCYGLGVLLLTDAIIDPFVTAFRLFSTRLLVSGGAE